MSYTVRWKPEAERHLAELWNAGPDRNAIAAAADQIDTLLAGDPGTAGEARTGTRRLLFRGPLAVLIDVRPAERVVYVLDVARNRRRRR
jgi:plasmid stabilization system protein ParE